jgi:hypothetical protein
VAVEVVAVVTEYVCFHSVVVVEVEAAVEDLHC